MSGFPPPLTALTTDNVTSRSRQPSAVPGPGVKTEIFKSKFDMIWTLIHLMFESKVGTVAREKISMKIGDLRVTRLHMN